jgi:hypothetical protein
MVSPFSVEGSIKTFGSMTKGDPRGADGDQGHDVFLPVQGGQLVYGVQRVRLPPTLALLALCSLPALAFSLRAPAPRPAGVCDGELPSASEATPVSLPPKVASIYLWRFRDTTS